LKYIHEFSYAEIADTLDIPRGTVMSRLYEARAQFRAQFLLDPDALTAISTRPSHAT